MSAWPVVPLGEVATVNPRMPRDLDPTQTASFLPMAAVSEDGTLAYQEERTVADVRKGYTYFERGDVLLAKITPCFENGKATQTHSLNEPIGFGSTEFHVVRGSDDLLPAYAFHLLWNQRFRREGERNMTGSAGQKRVPADFVKCLPIPLPPLAEQRRIAAVLDKADALRRRRREALALLDTLPATLFSEMFGSVSDHERVPIDDVVENARTGPFGSQLLVSEFVDEGVPVLGIDNVVTNRFIPTTPRFIPRKKYEQLKRYTVLPGDVLITIMGTCGRCAVVPDEVRTMVNTKHLCCLTPNRDRVLPEFVRAAFLYDQGAQTQLHREAKGAIMSGLNMGIIKGIRIPVPDVERQVAYVKQSQAAAAAQALQAAHLTHLDTLFTSLQSRAFAGEL